MNMEEEDIWKEMEEDLRKKYKQTGKGYQQPNPIMKVYAMEAMGPLSAIFIFTKYVIKHYIKQIKGLIE